MSVAVVKLSWDLMPNTDSYRIYENDTFLTEVFINSYEKMALPGETSYGITGVNERGEGNVSEVVVKVLELPSEPTNLAAEVVYS